MLNLFSSIFLSRHGVVVVMCPLYEDFPAMIYTGLWPLTLDGRFQEASRGQHFSVLFYFHDWPPATLLKIDDGKFTIESCDPATVIADGRIEGNFADVIPALDSIGSALKVLFSRKVKLVHKWTLLKFARILLTKRLPRSEGRA